MDQEKDSRSGNRINENIKNESLRIPNNIAETYEDQRWFIQTRSIVYYILGVIEVLLAFRFIFKLLGASKASEFVSFLYLITQSIIAPFSGIFRTAVTQGGVMQSIFEPATVIAMIVYAIIAKGVVSLVKLKVSGNVYK